MEFEKFILLAKEPSKVSRDDIPFLEKIIQRFPFFQAARVLLAKASGAASLEVKSAAAYTTERSILHDIMDSEFNANINLPNNLDFIQVHEDVDALSKLSSSHIDELNPIDQSEDDVLASTNQNEEEVEWPSSHLDLAELEEEESVETIIEKVNIDESSIKSELELEVDEVIDAVFEENQSNAVETVFSNEIDLVEESLPEESIEGLINKVNDVSEIEEEEFINEVQEQDDIDANSETEKSIDEYEDDSPISIDEIENRLQSFLSVRRKATEKSIIDDLSQNDEVDPSLLELAKRDKEKKKPKVESRKSLKKLSSEESETSKSNDFPYKYPVFEGDAERYILDRWEYEESLKKLDKGAEMMGENIFDPFQEHELKKLRSSQTFVSEEELEHQHDLIDRFIEKIPVIQKADYQNSEVPDAEVVDLTVQSSSTLKIAPRTESFAKILVRQGRLEEALEIYSALKLKYPSKNVYFASLIEKLKKEIISKRSR